MPLITLTTEWREDDVFNGIVKGKLSSACPGATVVNNAAAIPPLNIMHGAFVVRNTYSHYPEETIQMLFLSTKGSGENPNLLVRSHNHWFIGADNGMFNLILNAAPDLIISLDNSGNDDEITLFVGAAAALVNGKSPESLGKKITSLSEKVPLRATIDRNVIIGSVIFIDSYGNAITNITREVFFRVFEGREFRIMIKSNNYYTEKISRYYSDEPVGEIVTSFNTIDMLELYINRDNLCQLFAVETGDAVRVEARNQDRENNSLF